jgi:acyl-CoA dehydrogenase
MTALFDDWRARSPWYDETHEALAQSVRRFVDQEVAADIDDWENAGEVPRDLIRKAAEAGLLGLGYSEEYGGGGEDFDLFHKFVLTEELARPGYGGFPTALITHTASLPLVFAAGTDELKARIVPGILAGEKLCAIAITEPSGGSDVARLKTRAERRGDHYVVNGSKTFISHGCSADYVFVAVRTGGEGLNGLSVLMIEKGTPGFTATRLEKMGWHCNDTATLYFEDVEVPVENRLGPENGGFASLMQNLNNERIYAAHHCCAFARVCLDEAAIWARERETFGKRLVDHQAVRIKLADIARHIDATQAWVDLCAWQAQRGTLRPSDYALLKVQATQALEFAARECAHILGGASYIRGSKVERIYRETQVMSIAGGSESIILDLAGRQLFARAD